MGSCVSKKAARHGGAAGSKGKVAAPLPQEKENAMSPVVVEEEVKEVVLSETPVTRRPRPPPEPVKRRQEQVQEEEEASDACSASESASVASAKEKAAKVKAGAEQAVEKMALGAPEKVRVKRTAPEDSKPKGRAGNGRARSPSPGATQRRQQRDQAPEDRRSNGGAGSGRARSPSPGAAQRRQQGGQPPAAPRPRREQPAVASAFGCRSGRFSPSAARRAAESAVRRSHSAREADMALPAKRCLTAAIDGHANAAAAAAYGGGSGLARRDPGERSGRRSDSPTGKRPPASPSPMHRHASTTRKAAKEQSTPERARPRVRDGALDAGRGGDEPALLAGGEGERKEVAGQGALGQNPSVAMECFIFL